MFIHFYSVKTKPIGFDMSFIQEAGYVKLTMIVWLCPKMLCRCSLSHDNHLCRRRHLLNNLTMKHCNNMEKLKAILV